MQRAIVIFSVLVFQGMGHAAMRGHPHRDAREDAEMRLAFAQLRVEERQVRVEEERLCFERQQAAQHRREVEERRRQEARRLQAQQEREERDREERAERRAEAQRQRAADAQYQQDVAQATEFVAEWAREPERRLDDFMKRVIAKHQRGTPFSPPEVKDLLHREQTIRQALRIVEKDLRTRRDLKDKPDVRRAMQKAIDKGITGLPYKMAVAHIEDERAIQESLRESAREAKLMFLRGKGLDPRFVGERLERMSLDDLKREFGR